MTKLLEDGQALPDGLWVVKWIDYFQFLRGSETLPTVCLVLQQLKSDDVLEIERLSHEVISSEILGRPRGQPEDARPTWEVRKIAVGYLPLVHIGDVLRGQTVVTRLRTCPETIVLGEGSDLKALPIMKEREPRPSGWTVPYRTLNRFEFELGKQREVEGAWCWVVSTPEIEYIIPGTVVLQTFYGFHTRLANAICSGQWQQRKNELICLDNFDSGLRTDVDPLSGDWYIVVQAGLTREHAVRLAVLTLDPYGYECACEIYRQGLAQRRERPLEPDHSWFAIPKIPYRWDEVPFEMKVRGFPLVSYRSAGSQRRFLVSSIEAHSWPYPDQVVRSEIANSKQLGEEEPTRVEERPFRGAVPPPPVPADPQATPDHHHDPGKTEAINQAFEGSFRFLNEVKHELQRKRSNKHYPPSPPRTEASPSHVVSGGIPTSGEGRPAPMQAETVERCSSHQFELLLDALDRLSRSGRVTGFECFAPPPGEPLRCMRNGVPCWSFLSEDQVRRRGKRGQRWELIFDTVPSGTGMPRRSYPRCVLVLRVNMGGAEVLLFEIEPRASESGYRAYLMTPYADISWREVEMAVENIRKFSGRVDRSSLAQAFGHLSSTPIGRRHRYDREENCDQIKAINEAALVRALQAAVEGSGSGDAEIDD